jgi:hypothetical protein
MNGQMRRYRESLAKTSDPILLSQIDQSLNLRGIIRYAKDKGVKVEQLTEQEKMMFVENRQQ